MNITDTVWHWQWKEVLSEAKKVKGEAKYFPYIEELKAFDEYPERLTADQRYEDPKPLTRSVAIQKFLIDLDNKRKAIRLGAGAFRTVYGFRDNPDIILKVARGHSDNNKMNKDDAMLFTKYPLLAPRTYAHADDYKWIYMDNVAVAEGPFSEKYYNALRDTFPGVSKYITDRYDDDYLSINPASADELMYVIAMGASQLARKDREDSIYMSYRDKEIVSWVKEHLPNFAAVGSPAFIELIKAMTEFDISSSELRQKNLGYNKDGRLIIIDSSIFED